MPPLLLSLPSALVRAVRLGAAASSLLLAAQLFAQPKAIQPAGLAGFPAGGDLTPGPRAGHFAVEDAPLGPAQFDTSPVPLPPNVASLPLESTGIHEIGDLIRLSGAGHFIDSVTVTFSTWATRSEYGGSSPYGFTHPITLRIYAVDRSSGQAMPGATLATMTQSFLIPWRPEANVASASALRPWKADDGQHYTGYAFNLNFDVGALGVVLPDEVIYTLAFNTHHQGNAPVGSAGPHDKLHLGLTPRPPEPGLDVERDALFVRSGTATLQRATGWSAYHPAVRFTNSAYGTIVDAATLLRGMQSKNTQIEQRLRDAATLLSFSLPRTQWDGYNRLEPALGGTTFEVILEAVQELTQIGESGDPTSSQARELIFSLLGAAQSLTETALGDAIIVGGRAGRIARAQERIDSALNTTDREHYPQAVEHYWRAWNEAQAAVR